MRDALDVHGTPLKDGMIVRSVTDQSYKRIFGVTRGEIVNSDGDIEYNHEQKCEERIVEVKVLQVDRSLKPHAPDEGEICWAIDHHLEVINITSPHPAHSLVDIFDSCMGGD